MSIVPFPAVIAVEVATDMPAPSVSFVSVSATGSAIPKTSVEEITPSAIVTGKRNY